MCAASPDRRPHDGVRPSLSLDGEWDFSFDGPGARLSGEGHRIRSPGIWQAQFRALRNARGTGRYRRRIEIPPDFVSRRIILVMEGVFHESVVLVDDVPVAIYGDGWTPIEVDLTCALDGKTAFVLGIDARTPDDRHGGRFSRSLAGKQDWYGVQGGIWKSARLEARDRLHIEELAVRTSYDLAEGAVFVKGALSAPAKIRVTVSRREEAVTIGEFAVDAAEFEVELPIPQPDAWSPDAPNLYRVAVEVMRDGTAVDEVERTIGFRRLEAKNGRLFLNGEPFFMFGALDHDWHPEEECRPPSAAFLEQRIPERQGDGAQYAAVPRQDPRPALFRSGRPAGPDRLARHALCAVPRALDARGAAGGVPEIGGQPRSSSGRLDLDPVQRRMGHRPRRQSGRSPLADRDLRCGEGAGPR